MTVEARAKVNLTLEVYGKRPDGFHALRSVVAPISLADTLSIEPAEDGTIASDTGYGEKDLIVRAARALARTVGASDAVRRLGCRVRVTKRIPAGGGLGGGSADAAATLRALNDLWHLSLSTAALMEIGAAIGSDVPALVAAQQSGCAVLMEGRGERVSPLPPTPPRAAILANCGTSASTKEVYAACSPRTTPAASPVNDLEAPAVALYPEIAATLAALRTVGAKDVMMSGSGATCFGFAKDGDEARALAVRIASDYGYWTAPVTVG